MNVDSPHPEPARESAPLDEQLVAYLDGELDEQTSRHVETLMADDPELRDRLKQLGRAWELLDELERAETEGAFTETTLELVVSQAEQEARQREAQRPRLHRRRRALIGGSLLAAGLAGFLGMALLGPDPNRPLLEDLPVIENVDEYLQVLGNDQSVDGSIDFLRRLHQEELFAEEDQPQEDSHGP